jgi:outer membrane protein assembly factor BamB/enterochelin esterase-like enzyme
MTCFLPLLALVSLVTQDWPQVRGPERDGTVEGAGAFAQSFELRLAWKRELGSGYSAVVIAGDVVVGSFSDGTDDSVVALDVGDGSERWRVRIGPTFAGVQGSEDGPTSTPCIADGVVFAPGPRGRLLALGLDDGRELWSVDLVETLGAQIPVYGYGGSPLDLGGAVYLPLSAGDGTGGAAFDKETGEVRWTHTAGWSDYQNPLRLDDELMLAVDGGQISLIEAASGESFFDVRHTLRNTGRFDLAYPQITPLEDGRLLFTYDGETMLRELDLVGESLDTLWRSRELKQCYSPPVVHDGAIYGLSGTFLTCADLDTGERLWKSRPPGARGLILVGGHLVLFATTGDVVVVPARRDGYSESGRLKVAEGGGYTAPSFGAGRIFARNTVALACVEVVPLELGDVAAVPAAPAEAGALGELLERARASTDPVAVVDEFWAAHDAPLADEDRVHFLYRGEADDVAVVGDMTPDRSTPDTMYRVPGTDLFYRSYECDPAGMWQYTFLIDADRAVPDARSALTLPTVAEISQDPQVMGYPVPPRESFFAMPGWQRPAFLDGVATSGGRIESLACTSRTLRASRELQVYLPAGYDESETSYSVLYVCGGELWFAHGELKAALDALMQGGTCAPAIVVGLPYHVGSGDRMGGSQYARAILDEFAPLVAEHYRAGAIEVALGAADDATGVTALASLGAERFRRVAVQSPYVDPGDFRTLERATTHPAAVYIDWSRLEARKRDENTDYRAAAVRLAEHFRTRGCEVVGGEVPQGPGFASWTARLDDVLSFLLPPR